ncbi:MAG TPA: hypothetical protein VHU83_05075 [Bryobacteraceae bacterium]|nr:hypothetical protein [Bryobacteraceae bacterium]
MRVFPVPVGPSNKTTPTGRPSGEASLVHLDIRNDGVDGFGLTDEQIFQPDCQSIWVFWQNRAFRAPG